MKLAIFCTIAALLLAAGIVCYVGDEHVWSFWFLLGAIAWLMLASAHQLSRPTWFEHVMRYQSQDVRDLRVRCDTLRRALERALTTQMEMRGQP